MYEKFIEQADSPAEKDKFIDEMMKVYDKRIKYFGEEGYVLGRKATSWLKYKLGGGNDNSNEELKNILAQQFSDRHYTIVLAFAEEVDFEALNFPRAHNLKSRTNV